MPRLSTSLFIISLLLAISTVLGCGVMPAGQASTRTFTVTGFTLPVAMSYTDMPMVSAQASDIAPNRGAAQLFESRLVMQTVCDVLENQARNAVLFDAVILDIMGQLEVNVNFEPILCSKVVLTSDGRRPQTHYGKLLEADVAKCSEQSGLNASIGSVWIAFLLRN
ncbi:hypothetical protein KIN20_014511 [Parelaphostrongylus tenuis]|uniref:Lipoprotein n=1 Tax=Parelaphostrongylus tenuis TaxID=148309 RepID=A0AAD5MF22_PARTN|nr:hypothetical protein KIN20_014511 [Parelaphostrongylus tenuis]